MDEVTSRLLKLKQRRSFRHTSATRSTSRTTSNERTGVLDLVPRLLRRIDSRPIERGSGFVVSNAKAMRQKMLLLRLVKTVKEKGITAMLHQLSADNKYSGGEVFFELAELILRYTPSNLRLIMALLNEASKLGHAGAHAKLGQHLVETETDVGRGKALLQRAIDQREKRAIMFVAKCLLHGSFGYTENKVRAMEMFHSLAPLGVVGAQMELAFGYYHGIGVAKSMSDAYHWTRMAALQGHPPAQTQYGLLVEAGVFRSDDLKKREAESLEWFKEGANGGDALGAKKVGERLVKHGSKREALYWLNLAKDLGADVDDHLKQAKEALDSLASR